MITGGVITLAIVVLAREAAPPAATMLGALVLLVLSGVLEVAEAFAGFSNPATISIAGLFIVTRALRDHVPLDAAVARVIGPARSARTAMVRLLPGVAALSGVTANTPIVATLAPIVRGWAERHGVASSHLLMPLSFAAIVGGVMTTIGTGPNLVVSGMLEAAGHEPFGFFTMTPAGGLVALVGTAIIIGLAPIVLADRRSAHERIAGHEREYALTFTVLPGGSCDGTTVTQAGLRDLSATYLASVLRGGTEITPVAPETRLEGGDELLFVGSTRQVRDLLEHSGLRPVERPQVALLEGDGHVLVECVLAAGSPLVGSTLKERSFRGRYGGAVVAIHRAGDLIDGKLGTVRLHVGDALLIMTDRAFLDRWSTHADFAVVVPLEANPPPRTGWHRIVAVATFTAMIGVAASGAVPISTAVLAACTVLVATRAIGFRRALDALDRDVLLIVVAAIGLGAAVSTSGIAATVAGWLADFAPNASGLATLAVIVVTTMVLTELLTNVAAAALMAPLAIDVATTAGHDPTSFAVAVALGASASFLTPIGYQTNTIVYGLGGYRFGDYWRLGLPLTALTVAVALWVIPAVWW